MKALDAFTASAGGPVLTLGRSGVAPASSSNGPEQPERPEDGVYVAVALVAADRLELRTMAADLPPLPEVTAVACMLTDDERPVHLTPAADWPRITELHARRLRAGGVLTVVRFAAPVAAGAVLRRLADAAALGRRVPWAATVAGHVGPAELPGGPLDEGVLNPIGFDPDPARGITELIGDAATGLALHGVADRAEPYRLDPARGATPAIVATLRAHVGVRVQWRTAAPGLARTVAGLAMAGIPLVGEGVPPPAMATALGDELNAALSSATDPAELTDRLRREELSIRLRRAALLTHSNPAWRDRISRAAGRPGHRFPSCSVVLATRRPDQLEFALRQVRRQRRVDLEVVVVTHGFEADRGRVRALLDGVPGQVLSRPADSLFGDVLTAGARAASGDLVVKMDDDDWYGREFLLDLLLAREYSRADIVGTTAEMTYLHQVDRTVRGGAAADGSERFARFVAGGSLCLPRDLLHALRDFRPVRRFVDHQLLQAALAGGATVYRGHGLGYLLRRRPDGHTWDAGVDFFLGEDRVADQWPGFAPSRLLDVDPVDRPIGIRHVAVES